MGSELVEAQRAWMMLCPCEVSEVKCHTEGTVEQDVPQRLGAQTCCSQEAEFTHQAGLPPPFAPSVTVEATTLQVSLKCMITERCQPEDK